MAFWGSGAQTVGGLKEPTAEGELNDVLCLDLTSFQRNIIPIHFRAGTYLGHAVTRPYPLRDLYSLDVGRCHEGNLHENEVVRGRMTEFRIRMRMRSR